MSVIIKTSSQIHNIRESGKYLTELLSILGSYCLPGVNLLEIEQHASYFLMSNGITWCFKWYQGYPTNTCLSVNDGLVHCIPCDYVLQPWDVIKVDTGVNFRGGLSDAAITVVVWGSQSNPIGSHLVQTTKQSLDDSLSYLQAGKTLMDYGRSVYQIIKTWNCEVIKDLCGHGVGVKVHEEPHVCNRPHKSMDKITLKTGMVLALEPITALHSTQCIQQWPWNILTKWWDLWAQREYTVLITDQWVEILAWITENIRS
jgi:methionyl aminopeptidase